MAQMSLRESEGTTQLPVVQGQPSRDKSLRLAAKVQAEPQAGADPGGFPMFVYFVSG